MAVIAAVVFFLLVVRAIKADKRIVVSACLGLALAALIIFAAWDSIIVLLEALFPDSRNVLLVLQGAFFEDDIRTYIYEYLLGVVAQDPLSVRGAFSDNVAWGLVMPFYYTIVNPGAVLEIASFAGTGAHSLYVQILFQYGVVLGGVILLCLAGVLLRGIWLAVKNREPDKVALAALFLVPFVVSTFAGGSYLDNVDIMYALAGALALLKRQKKSQSVAEKTTCEEGISKTALTSFGHDISPLQRKRLRG